MLDGRFWFRHQMPAPIFRTFLGSYQLSMDASHLPISICLKLHFSQNLDRDLTYRFCIVIQVVVSFYTIYVELFVFFRFAGPKKPRSWEMSARSYALHSVCPNFFLFRRDILVWCRSHLPIASLKRQRRRNIAGDKILSVGVLAQRAVLASGTCHTTGTGPVIQSYTLTTYCIYGT